MERLKEISNEHIRRIPLVFTRFLVDKIYWPDKLIGIFGARGSGKTTLILQYMKKMLAVLSRIVPYTPNIQKLARQTGTSRDSLLKFLFYLEKAGIVKWLSKDTFGINYLNKPDKLYLQNTNLMYALTEKPTNKGNLRETFFLSQLSVNHKVTYPEIGDFLIDDKYTFEIGGKNKTTK